MAASGPFPLLVEGSWGPDPPKNLVTKLQMYFQSRKRSGGGECEVRQEPGSPPRFLVLFFPEDGEGRKAGGLRGQGALPSGDAWGWGTQRENPCGSSNGARGERAGPQKGQRGLAGALRFPARPSGHSGCCLEAAAEPRKWVKLDFEHGGTEGS